MFKLVSKSIIIIVLLALGLAACGPTATQAPAPTEAQAAPPTTAPGAPAATEGGAPAAGTNWCSDTKIVFFPGGSAGGGFETVVYNGAKAAAADTGANVQYVWSDWDPSKMTSQFTQAVATKPDGIAIMGHPGDKAFDPLIDDAESKGIIVTSMNTQLPDAQAKYASKGFGYAGAVLYQAGYALGQEAVKRSGVKSGDKAFLWGLISQAGRGERTKGVKDALEKAGLKVIYQEIDDATNKSAASGVPTFTGIFSANPDIKLMVTDHGNLTGTVQTFLEAAGKKPGEVYAAGFDMSGNAVTAIKGGWLQLVIDQQQYLQGYFGVLQICLSKHYGFAGLQIDTGAGFADKDNIDQLAALVQKQIR
ncbi:MAG TPA: substrate-binding domain-containing protein [Anaerolineaceae bacterium]|nr:substrate-binding domain-containing protein [Anaerolineaceae bacterium]